MGKGKLALGKGLKELLPDEMIKQEGEESRDVLIQDLKIVKQRINTLGYSLKDIEKVLEEKNASRERLKKVLRESRHFLKTINSLETVLKQMDSLKLVSYSDNFKYRIRRGERPEELLKEAEKVLKKSLIKRSKGAKKKEEEEIGEVQRLITESRESIAEERKSGGEVKLEREKKIEELSKSLDELSKIMESAEEESPLEPSSKEKEKGEEIPDREMRLLDTLKKLKDEGYFIGELEFLLGEKGIDEAEKDLKNFIKQVNKMKEFENELNTMDLSGFEREVKLIKIKLKYPHLVDEVENDIKRLKELKSLGKVKEMEPTTNIEKYSADFLINKAKKEYIGGNLKEAKKIFMKVLSLNPNNPTAKFMIKRINMRLE